MKQFLLAASLLTFIGSQASAGYFDNRGDWKDLPQAQKVGFVQGVLTEWMQKYTTDSTDISSLKEDVQRCVLEEEFKGSDLIDIIDNHYTNLENWTNSPHIALRIGLLKVCRL